MSISGKWGYFSPVFGFSLILNRGGYFDQRYSIDINLAWGLLSINLPFKTTCQGTDWRFIMKLFGYT